ncbi:SanA/YdcF family protein [Clostridium gasigenes]|uniref:SanA/YdcF family protein n=1 Tax=Clostridium gasigenes TaxID=94869 RepID=UPI001C0A9561|nr:ElyC/SanA/YdcF family protein [Clostridium gasigenes]MBU3108708.1 YdcF family protein [Clostridium gasigenes]
MNKKKKVIKHMIISVVILIFISLVGAIAAIMIVQKNGQKNITTIESLNQNADAIIVLGAGVKDDGSPSDILEDRLKTAIEVYNSGVCSKFILSGDHGRESYNEVSVMKEYIINNCDVEEKNVFLDHAGFSTYDSIYRAKDIFEVENAIIITNEYHLPRALYLAKKMGINANGISSDIRNYLFIESYKSREKLAQLKDFVYINLLKPEPKFLGESIPVSSSDGSETDDDM